MNSFATLSFAILAFALSSCASGPQRLSQGLESQLSGHTITCVRNATEPFRIVTPSQAFAGGAMAMAGNAEGINAMMVHAGRNTALPGDPGLRIERALMSHFVNRFGMQPKPTVVLPLAGPYGKTSRRPVTGADYVLEISGVGWCASYFPTAWLRYRIGVYATAKLIDGRTGKVLAGGSYGASPTQRSEGLGSDDVRENKNGVLTRDVALATDEIIAHFTHQAFEP